MGKREREDGGREVLAKKLKSNEQVNNANKIKKICNGINEIELWRANATTTDGLITNEEIRKCIALLTKECPEYNGDYVECVGADAT